MSKVIFLADYFLHQENGGAEKTDDVLINYFNSNNYLYEKKNCHQVDVEYLKLNNNKIFLIGNFVNLPIQAREYLRTSCKYIIYEHDFKLDKFRNPLHYKDFLIPEENKVNVQFFKCADAVVALSKYHKKIIELNIDLDNLYNTESSLLDEDTLDQIDKIYKNRNVIADVGIIDSKNPIKCTKEAVKYAIKNNLDWRSFSDPDYYKFLEKMSQFNKLIVFSGHLETGPRVAIEAKMLGLKVICDKRNISVANTEWFHWDRLGIVNKVRQNRIDAIKLFHQLVEDLL